VGEPVAIDVRRAQSRPVIVVDLLVRLARVVHHVVLEADAAGRSPVSEAEVVHDTRAGGQLAFLAGALEQTRGRARCLAFAAGPLASTEAEQPHPPRP